MGRAVVNRRSLKYLAITLAVATPPMFGVATSPRVSEAGIVPTAPAISSQLTSASANPDDRNTLAQAFQKQASELLWSGTLLLDRQSADTIENVRLSAEAVDLTALRANEIFSFNEIVGIRTEGKGYRPGLMYSNGEVVMGVGGGICIASTILYKAVLESGLKILDRHPHSGPVSYADPGRDAAISFGWADLRFKNNTGAVLLVRCVVRDNELMVALYGRKQPGRAVEIVSENYEMIPFAVVEREDVTIPEGENKVQQEARPGFSVTTVRVIRENGKLVSREVMGQDTVLPRNKIVLIPPKRPNLPGIELPFDMANPQSGTLPLPGDSASALPSSDLTERTASQ